MNDLISLPVTNTSVNPARSTATALFRAVRWRLDGSAALAVLALPVVGAAIAGLVHTSVLESPVEEAQVSRRVASHVHV